MIENTGLEDLCIVHDKAEDIKHALLDIMEKPFEEQELVKRREVLGKLYSNKANAARLMELLFTVSQ